MANVAVVMAWLAVLLRAPGTWRGGGTPARRALWLALLALALGWTLRVPWGYHGLDRATGVENLSQLVGDGLALTTGCAILGMLLFQTNDLGAAYRRLLVRGGALITVIVAMTVAFSTGSFARETTEFVTEYRSEPEFLAYSIPYLAFLSYVFFDLTRLCRRYAHLSERPYLTTGMRLIQIAGVLGIVYVALRVAFLVAVQAVPSHDFVGIYEPVSKTLVAALSILAIAGAVLPAVGSRVQNYRAHRELYPLWSALHDASPEIALTPPASPTQDRLSWRDLSFRLHRRVIEIRDGQVALRPYLRRDVAEEAARRGHREQLDDEELSAAVEAATLAAGIEDKVQERPAADPVPMAPGAVGSRLSDEVFWLRRVARNFRTEKTRRVERHVGR